MLVELVPENSRYYLKLLRTFLIAAIVAAGATLVIIVIAHVASAVSSEGLKMSDVTTLVAGVVGAALGGGISWLQARQASKETLVRDAEARHSHLENHALSTLLKVQRIANGYHTHKMYFWRQLRDANEKHTIFEFDLWEIIKSQVGSTESVIIFAAEELVPLQVAGETGLINDCGLLAERFSVIERSMIEYSRLRREIENVLVDYSEKLPNGLFLTRIPKHLENRIATQTYSLEQFVRSLYADIVADDDNARHLCEKVSEAFVRYFHNGAKFKVQFVGDDQ